MLNLPENELFSAYIDGELTAEEQAQVEEVLSSSAAARQLVDDLRSLSQSLQALPAYHLDNGLAESVLRRAERQMLSQPAAPLPEFHQVEPLRAERSSWARRLLRPRNFAWSAIAIAVALVLMMMESEKSSRPGSSPNGLAQSQRPEMLIEPAHNDAVIEAVEQPRKTTSEPAAVAASDAGLAKPVAEAAPDVAARQSSPPVRPICRRNRQLPQPSPPSQGKTRRMPRRGRCWFTNAGLLTAWSSPEGPLRRRSKIGVVLVVPSGWKMAKRVGGAINAGPDCPGDRSFAGGFEAVPAGRVGTTPTCRGPADSRCRRGVATGAAAGLPLKPRSPRQPPGWQRRSANLIASEPKSAPAKAAVPAEATGIGAGGHAALPAPPIIVRNAQGSAPGIARLCRVRFLFKSTAAADKETHR